MNLATVIAVTFIMDCVLISLMMIKNKEIDGLIMNSETIQAVLCVAAIFGAFHFIGLNKSGRMINLRAKVAVVIVSFFCYFCCTNALLLDVVPVDSYKHLALSFAFFISAYYAVMYFSFCFYAILNSKRQN